ncbi:Protein RESTRICTED TEV MOVEMENT 3 [Cardamine amara subsp. amara]|uniref:Protein RESTRICTED TEV MOVEMENT 3 n=1 Tax=Cardamine amara subsp. amara TaxID=228776 RepID=A0ABD1C8I0_CARAN
MGKHFNKKITWVIKNFSSLQSKEIYSDHFVVNGCKWCLSAYPKGNKVDTHLSLFLEVANHGSLPSGWRRHARYLLTILNQCSEKNFQMKEAQQWFDEKCSNWGRRSMFPLDKIHAKDSGFLINGELKIVVEIEVLEVIGKVDVTEETSIIMETIDINGFQLLPSQAKYVSRMFERHSEIASGFRPNNPSLRTGYMSLLLCLIESVCQSPQELSKDDLYDAHAALESMTSAGFKLDWLEKKLYEVSKNKENKEASEIQLQEMEKKLEDMKQKCSAMEALVEKKKAKVSAENAPLSFDDVV